MIPNTLKNIHRADYNSNDGISKSYELKTHCTCDQEMHSYDQIHYVLTNIICTLLDRHLNPAVLYLDQGCNETQWGAISNLPDDSATQNTHVKTKTKNLDVGSASDESKDCS